MEVRETLGPQPRKPAPALPVGPNLVSDFTDNVALHGRRGRRAPEGRIPRTCGGAGDRYGPTAMNENTPPSSAPLPPPSPSSPHATGAPATKRRPWLLYGCGAVLGLILIIVATVAFTIWYIQRPIKPVVLSPAEKTTVEAKLQRMGDPGATTPGSSTQPATTSGKEIARSEIAPSTFTKAAPASPALPEGSATATAEGKVLKVDPTYVPGSKELRLTERELNGLLNANTDLGNTVRIELGRDAINAYVAAPIPADVPVFGGKIFRARGRFRISLSPGTPPVAVLEDVTVFGLSLPKEWLGGIKGENLLDDAMGKRNGSPILRGVKSLRVEPGALVIEVND